MSTATSLMEIPHQPGTSIQQDVEEAINELMASLPKPADLSAEQRRGMIARYTAVLEGNFIYWMTGALLSIRAEASRTIVVDNLMEEVRDSHPHMLRKFAIAAHALPTESDTMAVYNDLTNVRLFIGRLSAIPIIAMMAFFEGFIQRFMAYLADLAERQGSQELEYTNVHGVCDIAHTEGLFRALEAETEMDPASLGMDRFEGVALLRNLMHSVIHPAEPATILSPFAMQ